MEKMGKMLAPPLQLKSYFYTTISVSANKNFDPNDIKNEIPIELKVNNFLARTDDESRVYELRLEIFVEQKSDIAIPYTANLEVVGIFDVSSVVQEENVEKLLKVTGSSMLYGMARDFLLTVTSRGPWSPLMLPTVSFLSEKPKESLEDNT